MIEISGCAIINNGKILLLKRRDSKLFEFPGGKIKNNETYEECAIRETKEEIGVEVKVIKYLGHRDFNHKETIFRSHAVLSKIISGNPSIMEESVFSEMKWIEINDLDKIPIARNVKLFFPNLLKE